MDNRKSYLLRIDPELWAELEAWAAAELRSINGQIEYLLRQAVGKRKRASLRKSLSETQAADPKKK
ncbi:MAG: Arc family DNA-binding protein [Acidobacteria bacterium]|nr:Arc family DNA-binding protein [Acidobacteriota bacterium]